MGSLETAGDLAFAPIAQVAHAMRTGMLAAEALAQQRPRNGHR